MEKKIHLFASIDQQCLISKFVKDYVSRHASSQSMSKMIISNLYENPLDDTSIEQKTPPQIQIQIEDFDGSFVLPFYARSRSLANYFNSNMRMQNFIIADIINNVKNVIIYYERGIQKVMKLYVAFVFSIISDYDNKDTCQRFCF